MTTSLRQQICGILAAGALTARQVADRLGVQSRAEVRQVRDAIKDLHREGKVRGTGGGAAGGKGKLWRLAEATVSVQEKIWRAMCLKYQKGQPWTHAEIARLAGATRDYVRRYSGFLKKSGYIQQVGMTINMFHVWPGKEKAPAPHWNRRAVERKSRELAETPGPAAILARMKQSVARVQDCLGMSMAHFEQAQEILLGMERDLARAAGPHGEAGDGESTGDG